VSTTLAVPHRSQPLSHWLRWLETIHPVAIDMGLERVSRVADRLKLRPVSKPLILVGGTNGKGSTVAMLSAIYREAGYTTGAYTSPHILNFCERIRINGNMVDEASVVDALAFIEAGRGPESLTYFEYTTLAAMRVFSIMQCEVILVEVGLGGRLDATNIWDADCSIVTSIALDHEAYLGSDVSTIATEKAAIGRSGKPFILGASMPPASLAFYIEQHDFKLVDVGSMAIDELPETVMPGEHQRRNAGCARAAIDALQPRLPVSEDVLSRALMNTTLEGRFERRVADGVNVVLDVAHNPAGALALAEAWVAEFDSLSCECVFASLADKDVAGVVAALEPFVHTWHCLTLAAPRATTAQEISRIVRETCGVSDVMEYEQVKEAIDAALVAAKSSGRPVLVTGSFYTIAAVQSVLQHSPA